MTPKHESAASAPRAEATSLNTEHSRPWMEFGQIRWDCPRALWNETTADFGWKAQRFDPTIGFFACLLLIQMIVWTLLPALTQPNVPAETLALLTAGRQFAWGYPVAPPLAVWLASGAAALTAPSIWPVYFVSQVCAAISIWSCWILARRFLHPWTALCAALALMGGFALTVSSAEFSTAQVAQCCWTLSILAFHTALTNNRRRYWVATGICLGLGILASYGTILLMIAMFAFTVWEPRARRCWDSSWPFLAAFAMAVVVLPHALWLANHQFVTIRLNIASASSVADHLVQPLSFLGLQLLSMVPLILVLAPLVAYFSFEETSVTADDDREFARRYLLWMTCLPPAVIFCLALVAGPSSGIFATASVWSYLGIVILMWSHLREDRIPWRRVILRTGVAGGLLAALLIVLNIMWPQLRGSGSSVHFPGNQLAQAVQGAWLRSGYGGNVPVVAGDAHLVRNVGWYAESDVRPSLYPDLDPLQSAGINDQSLSEHGGVVVWKITDPQVTVPAEISGRLTGSTLLEPVSLQWQSQPTLPPVQIGMAIVHPRRVTPAAAVVPQQNPYQGTATQSYLQYPYEQPTLPNSLQSLQQQPQTLQGQPAQQSLSWPTTNTTLQQAPTGQANDTQSYPGLQQSKAIKDPEKPQWNWVSQ
ncbi:glycosyltransferase family 39 protein [Planctomicrobium sp. SH664]|uniref:glycosyltransferase family 39 protein n=1 Tax=Planctomicrobium sp. SH664 TaxID=3448125 RepID=UPI003F5C8564